MSGCESRKVAYIAPLRLTPRKKVVWIGARNVPAPGPGRNGRRLRHNDDCDTIMEQPHMATFRLKRFSEPGRLKTVHPRRLAAFFRPFSQYLTDRGFTFAPDLLGCIDHHTLAAILISPDERVPRDMVDALFFVDEMADEEGMDDLLEAASQAGLVLDLGPDPTPADVAIEVWSARPDLVKWTHARGYALRQKRFVYFRDRLPRRSPFPEYDETELASLQNHLEDWFENHKRGRYSRVSIFDHGSSTWILIRHGLAFKREGSVSDGQSSMEYYRPEKYDVLVYDPETGTLGVHADGKRLTEIYLYSIGLFLFGDEKRFSFLHELTLDPLKRYGACSLACDDIAGLDDAKLVELTRIRGGPYERMAIDKASDLFADFAAEGYVLPETARLTSAGLEFVFTGDEKARRVTIRPPNTIIYSRTEDRELVEPFLKARGFMPVHATRQFSEAQPLLAGA